MRRAMIVLGVAVAWGTGGSLAAQQPQPQPMTVNGTPPPLWAYPVNPPAPGGGGGGGGGRAAPDPAPLSLPGAARTYTMAEVRNGFGIADWRPETHPEMPSVISTGRAPDLRACGFCHYPNGQGRPENAGVAGLPAEYIVQQMADFKNGSRRSSEPRMGPPRAMITVAEHANEEEVRIAAEYFASFPFKPWIEVRETRTVPRTRIAGGMFVPLDDGGTEPIGQRILEVPVDFSRTEIRDPASPFIAYVPEGSVARGEQLVKTGGGKTTACGLCHGDDLRGLGPIPPLAGRSPSYTARQLFDFQSGARRGAWSGLMTGVVQNLTLDDLIAIAAYTSSRAP